MQIAGATILITGANGGLGTAIADTLAGRGAHLIVSGRRQEALEPLAQRLGARVLVCDLADRASVEVLAKAAHDVDVLVANAALPASGTLDDYSVEQIDRALDVNLRAPVRLAQALLPGMLARGRGQVVFIGSVSGVSPSAGGALYSATKFGLRGFALSLRDDLRDTGVSASLVLPGFIADAGLFAKSGVKLPRVAGGTKQSRDVARAVVRAIERDRAELFVAPIHHRVGAAMAAVAPELAMRVQRRLGGHRVAADLAAAQRENR